MAAYLTTVRRFSRNGKIILSYTFAKGLVLALQGLIYNLYLLSLHFSPTLIGVLDAMAPVTVLLVSVPMGLLADRIGRKGLLIACTMSNPFVVLGMAFTASPIWQVVLALLNGVLTTFYWIAYPAIIVESSSDADRQHLFSVNSWLLFGIGSVGYLLGGLETVLAGQILHQSPNAVEPLRWGLVLNFAVGLVGAIPLLWLREMRRTAQQRQERRSYNYGLFARLLVPDALLSFGAGAVLAFNQLYFTEAFRLTAGDVGLFLAMSGLAGSFGALVSPLLTGRLGTARAAIALQGTAFPLIAGLALAPSVGVAMGVYTLWGLVRSAIDPTYTAFIMEQVPAQQRSTLSGLYSATWAIGFGAGPIATGGLQSATGGFTAPFLVAAACYGVATTALYTFFGRRARRPEQVADVGAAASRRAR